MNKELLFESFSYLDESLLERSEADQNTRGETARPRAPWGDILKTAACFAVLLGALAAPFIARRHAAVGTPSAQFATRADAEAAEHEWEASYTPSQSETDNWDAPSVVGSPAIATLPNNGSAEISVAPWVESYPMDAEACYAAPKNGEVNFSMPLREAMHEYGDGARYRVVVDRFQNEQPMDPVGDGVEAEMDRLAAVGIVSAYERLYDHDALECAYFTIHSSRYELEHFPPSDDYGYMLFLYGERVPDYEPQEPAASGGGNVAVTSPLFDEICGLPPAEDLP